MRICFIFFYLLFSSSSIDGELVRHEFVVWNVGQGQWVTLITPGSCLHFDMGGERFPRGVQNECASKQNIVGISHWDLDHISFLKKAKRLFPSLCRVDSGMSAPESPQKRKLISGVPICQENAKQFGLTLPWGNDRNWSAIAEFEKRILVSGDAPQKEEAIWRKQRPLETNIAISVLGHHGSRTSSSPIFLRGLPHLRQSIASCRTRKYGHPHPEVLARLRSAGVAVLKTQDWGNIHFSL